MKTFLTFARAFALVLLAFVCFSQDLYAQYLLSPAYPSLAPFSRPVEIQRIPDATNRIVVVQQRGIISVFENSPATSTKKTFINLSNRVSQSGNETGLLGCAFHPDFIHNKYVYLNYTGDSNGQLTSFISRFTVSAENPDSLVRTSEKILLTLSQPFENHNGGCLRFGPDGYLYASFGDGGSGGDPYQNGQNKSVLLGKILRIDVDKTQDTLQYAIPSTNPFAVNSSGYRREIYSYGMRNTWRFSFDELTGKLWAGDVGQGEYEEIDIINVGDNCGWNIMEGFHCYNSTGCDQTGLALPVFEYSHNSGDNSITGGYVYHGNVFPTLKNNYIYGDEVSGRIWAFDYNGGVAPTNTLLLDKTSPGTNISSFGVDADGEIFVIAFGSGKIMKLRSDAAVDEYSRSSAALQITLQHSILARENTTLAVTITTPNPGKLTFAVVDAIGREYSLPSKQLISNSTAITFDLRNMIGVCPAGAYIFKITDGNHSAFAKFMIE